MYHVIFRYLTFFFLLPQLSILWALCEAFTHSTFNRQRTKAVAGACE